MHAPTQTFFSFEQGAAFIRDTTSNLQYRGGTTSTNAALNQTINEVFGEEGDRANVRNVVIVITDGVPFPPNLRGPTIDSAESLQQIATMFAVGITDNIDPDLLARLSSQPREPDRNYFKSPDFDELEATLEPLLASVLHRSITPTETPSTTAGNIFR